MLCFWFLFGFFFGTRLERSKGPESTASVVVGVSTRRNQQGSVVGVQDRKKRIRLSGEEGPRGRGGAWPASQHCIPFF